MINKQEFVKLTIIQKYDDQGIYIYKDRWSDITLDLAQVIAFNPYIDLLRDKLRTDVTEVTLSGGILILVKMSYNDFKSLIT